MNFLLQQLENSKEYLAYREALRKTTDQIILSGLSSVGKIQLVAATKQESKENICIITYNEMQAKKMVKDLKYFTSEVCYFPKREIASYDYIAESKDLPYERIDVLNKIYKKEAGIIVTTIEAIMQKMIHISSLYHSIITFQLGKTYEIEKIKQTLIHLGYERNDLVEGKGQFSIRGGILDIATSEKQGVRIEFWGDEVDSIREFSIASQRSNKMLKQISIFPSHEFILEADLEEVIKRIEKKAHTKEDIELMKTGDYISKIDKYFNCFYPKQVTLLDYLQQKDILILDEITKIKQRMENLLIDNNNLIHTLIEKERIVPDSIQNISNFQLNWEEFQKIYLEEKDITSNEKELQEAKLNEYHFHEREVHFYKSEMNLLASDLQEAIKQKKRVILLAGNSGEATKMLEFLKKQEIPHQYYKSLEGNREELKQIEKVNKGRVIVSEGSFSTGIESYDTNSIVISGEEFFSSETKRKKAHNAFKQGEKVVFADLKQGDFVVHRTHGIGQFIGVNTITADNVTKDYIKVKYKNDDILYVPTNSLDNVRKYIGGGEQSPKINKLGSKEWDNTKNRVKNNLKEVAKDLIELYAKRQKEKGYAFSEDTPWQKQFEDSFPYKETDDQLRCIEEVKKDMELPRPMDRLLCGDVGYGKTEVAIRAAFKAVMDQKQVAYLVPTTILANQQFEEFKSRMEEYPMKVELLNRFRTKKEQEQVIKKLKTGEVDVVVGTHRMLSQDVSFKDLGLLIIDEEHRFGVKDKEKIKKWKASVDVLTMTATPIPRTLHMSIVGIRDMSVIYEPPQNRKPVQTYVLEQDKEVIKEAITKELERDGQVFYLFNNVEGITRKAAEIERLVPEAKVAVAHGKMTGRELEDIMMEFIEKKVNVLVCTTILESGIDIPNANTIIVENADRLGLAQLYQIRGRVGRADKQAYAYIMYKRDKLLSEVADKRLKAMKEFTEFGSGFKIAMRDLEIRGAGSLLGEIQHGHMEQVGYDTYCKLLEEVVKEMQGQEIEEEQEIQIDVNISSYIPDSYIENGSQKIEIYQDIALARSEKDIEEVIDEIIDRYGAMPKEVENLIEIARIKELCRKANVVKLVQRKESVVFYFEPTKFHMEEVDNLLKIYHNQIRFSPGKDPYITLRFVQTEDSKVIKSIKDFLKLIK